MKDLKRIELEVEGMDCTNCALGIKKQLDKIGFAEADVIFTSKQVVFLSSGKDETDKAIEKIDKMGYTVVSRSDEKTEIKRKWFTLEWKFFISLFFTLPLLSAMFLPFHELHDPIVQLILTIPVLIIGLLHFGRNAFYSLKSGVPNMDVLVITGAIAAFTYSLIGFIDNLGPDFLFFETTAGIITLILLGNLLEHLAVKKTTSAIDSLVRMQDVKAKRILIDENGKETKEEIDFNRIHPGDLFRVNTGDKIPVDGEIVSGEGYADESLLTGESLPIKKDIGNAVIGSSILSSGTILMKATVVGRNTILSQIIKLVKKAQEQKPPLQNLADRISAIFVPVVVGISLITFALSFWIFDIALQASIMRAIAVLVIACPCALGLAIPAAVMVGVGKLARSGILVKGSDTIQRLASVQRIIFDKTGTLTTGSFEVKEMLIEPDENPDLAKSYIAGMERHSGHPMAQSLLHAFADVDPFSFAKVEEEKGIGMRAWDNIGDEYAFGSARMAGKNASSNFDLFLLRNSRIIASLRTGDQLREDAKPALESLSEMNVNTIILSGDAEERVVEAARKLNVSEFYFKKLPSEKFEITESLSKEKPTAMVGDGINDAPALARATVGISLSKASQVAMESAGVILMNGKLELIPRAIRISRMTVRVIKQNLFWAFFYNVIAIPLAALGYLDPLIAALSMAFSDVFVVMNALRLRISKS
ncbi:MAG: cation-translocating P-type ATPase [Bacteroidota bacterium]